jgi:signal transduction histidine kinase
METWVPSILVLSAVLNLFIGVLIMLQGYRGVFIFTAVAVAFWDLSILFFYLNLTQGFNSATSAHFFAILFAVSFYLFALKFPREFKLKINRLFTYHLPILCFIIISWFVLFTNLFVGDVNHATQSYDMGKFYLLYGFFLGAYLTGGSVILFKQYFDTDSTIEKNQIKFILFSALISILISTVFDLVFPYFNIFSYLWVGPSSTLLLVASVSVAILKYHLFSIRLIIVETALILLNFLLFANAVLSKGGTILLLNSLLFLSIFILSIFLIRGIYKDIRDRERIEALVKDMAVANKRLFALEQQKTEFVSIASHQLRTPMTVIKGYASMVLEGAFGVLPKEAKDAMEKLYKSSDKIVALVEDLLTVSRIEQGRGMPIFETINFVSFMQELLVPVAAEMRDAGLKFSFDITKGSESAQVPLDKKKFEQALRHIIGNAIKYTKAPGSVNLTISNDTTQHRVYLSISDTGIGMTEEQVKTLMEKSDIEASARKGATNPKEKEDGKIASSTSSQKASGIGFYIAQEIINAHYGSLRIESPGHNKGATVIIELPELQ